MLDSAVETLVAEAQAIEAKVSYELSWYWAELLMGRSSVTLQSRFNRT